MDEAWKLEQEFWRAATAGESCGFYREHMTADGFLVLPSGVFHRQQLILNQEHQERPTSYELSEPHMVLVDGESVLITYSISSAGNFPSTYLARISSLYTWNGGGWALAFRQHTPDASNPEYPF